MTTYRLCIRRTFIHASEVPSERCQTRPRSQSLLLGKSEFGLATVDARVGTTATLLERNGAASCLPQQPEQGKKKRRPCKDQRDRIKKKLAEVERQINVNPHDVDVSAVILPSCYEEWTQRHIRDSLQRKLEETLKGQSKAVHL